MAAPTSSAQQAPAPTVGVLNANIIETAGGSLPITSTPLRLTLVAQTGFQLLLFLEVLEVYLYYEGLQNLTSEWSGDLSNFPNDTIEVITKTAAQEDIHVATLQGVLENNNVTIIPPCNYSFPVSTPQQFFALGNIITPTNFGSIIGLESEIAESDPSTVLSSTSILATEVRHEVFLRSTNGQIPNPAPFDTGIPPSWAYHIGLQYIVPGSCPVEVDLPTYPALYPDPDLGPQFAPPAPPTTFSFTWDVNQDWVTREGSKQLYVAWLNLANQPQYTLLNRTGAGSGETKVPKALENTAYVALTSNQPDNLPDLAGATLAGPLVVPIS
ncbi:hypothetical protein MMC28_003935 [Mycoblastus sanguinarius]|nr:hypothetical protein [Mycoblastus sanguinarius]